MTFRITLALLLLLPAAGLLKAAYWICPELNRPEPPTGQWLDAPQGWDQRVN